MLYCSICNSFQPQEDATPTCIECGTAFCRMCIESDSDNYALRTLYTCEQCDSYICFECAAGPKCSICAKQ